MPDGQVHDFDIRLDGRAGAILALTPERQVIVIRQFRPGPASIQTDLPGGGIGKDEDPAAALARELREETGFAGEVEVVGFGPISAYSTAVRYRAVATNCQKVGEQELDEREHIEVELVSLEEFRKLLRGGKVIDMDVAYAGLEHLGLL